MVSLKEENICKEAKMLLENMTLEEKIGQLVQYGRLKEAELQKLEAGKIGSFLNVAGADKVNKLQEKAMKSKNPIPLIIGDDVIHGYKTIFPIPLGESCSWDLKLIEETSEIAAEEASTEGINCIFAPMIDITRDPRWGRVAEGTGEDVFLASQIARAKIRGIQSNKWNDRPYVTACPKHFIAYGAAEGGRDYSAVDVSERCLRETYLPPFTAALDEGAYTIMCSFNDLNGIPSSANKFILRKILRQELGFEGLVISDWESIEELIYHGIAKDKKEASLKSIEAGVDIDMHSGSYEEHIHALIDEGKLDKELLDEAVLRILKVKIALNLFNNTYTDTSLSKKVIRSTKNVEKALEAARKSIVLLKNKDCLLPLNKNIKSIGVIGPLAEDKVNPLGCWALKGEPKQVTTVLEGIKHKLKSETAVYYEKGCNINSDLEGGIDRALELAKKVEKVVLVLGESSDMSGENHNRAYIGIPEAQKKLLKALHSENIPVVLVLMNGRPLTLTWEEENIPAIIEAWHLGDESGNAIADVIFGDYNPSGKLTMSFPRCEGQIPVYYNKKNTGRPNFKKYLDVEETPLYPFGYGLSYTQFNYKNIKLSSKKIKQDEKLTITAEIENVGKIAGDEIVQLYIRDMVASITRPIKELKGFKRVHLDPGECKEIKFEITAKELGFYDEYFNFVVEKGDFKVWIGPNSIQGLKENFEVI